MRIVKPAALLVKGQFVVVDEQGNVLETVPGPQAVLHYPHEAALVKYINECVGKIEGGDG